LGSTISGDIAGIKTNDTEDIVEQYNVKEHNNEYWHVKESKKKSDFLSEGTLPLELSLSSPSSLFSCPLSPIMGSEIVTVAGSSVVAGMGVSAGNLLLPMSLSSPFSPLPSTHNSVHDVDTDMPVSEDAVIEASVEEEVLIIGDGAVRRRRFPPMPKTTWKTYFGEHPTMTTPWWSNSCAVDGWFASFWHIFHSLNTEIQQIFITDFPKLGALFLRLLNKEISLREAKQELYGILDIKEFWSSKFHSIDAVNVSKELNRNNLDVKELHILQLGCEFKVKCLSMCCDEYKFWRFERGVHYYRSDMIDLTIKLFEKNVANTSCEIHLENFIETFAQLMPYQYKFTSCQKCKEVSSIALTSRGVNPFVLQIDLLAFYEFKLVTTTAPKLWKTNSGFTLSKYLPLLVHYNHDVYNISSVIYSIGGCHFMTRLIQDNTLWDVDGMEKKDGGFRGYGKEVTTSEEKEYWFPMFPMTYGENKCWAVYAFYVKQ
jgi:hypothetical protein